MIKKTILLENKASLSTRNLQLLIKSEIRETTIPIEEIGFLVIDHPEIFLSMPAMNLLVENNTSIIICGKNHLPNGMFLNLNSHHIQQEIFKNQIEASVPLTTVATNHYRKNYQPRNSFRKNNRRKKFF